MNYNDRFIVLILPTFGNPFVLSAIGPTREGPRQRAIDSAGHPAAANVPCAQTQNTPGAHWPPESEGNYVYCFI